MRQRRERPDGDARRRRGNYTLLFGLLVVVLMGFGALGIDLSYLRLAESEAQDVADAASQAALVMLRQTGDEDRALQVATELVARNTIAGEPGVLKELQIGSWVDDAFTPSPVDRNAARAVVERDVPMLLGPIFDWHDAGVAGESISAQRELHVILVVDITNSWNQGDFAYARDAAVAFFDVMAETAGPDDRLGMVVFTGRYGVEHTPLMLMNDAVAAGVREQWETGLYTASKAGNPSSSHPNGCEVHSWNNFASPPDGCFPTMWREYKDESGTDHTTGLQMATQMFDEYPDDGVYRAAIILTDGNPNGTGAHTQRAANGYVETRWRWFMTPKSRTTQGVIDDSVDLAAQMYADDQVNIWAVSFVANAWWMQDVVQGDGYYFRASTSSALVPIFQDIAESLPLAIVR